MGLQSWRIKKTNKHLQQKNTVQLIDGQNTLCTDHSLHDRAGLSGLRLDLHMLVPVIGIPGWKRLEKNEISSSEEKGREGKERAGMIGGKGMAPNLLDYAVLKYKHSSGMKYNNKRKSMIWPGVQRG